MAPENEPHHQDSLTDEMSEEEKRDMIEQVRELRREHDTLKSDLHEEFVRYLRSLAGTHADVLLCDRVETIRSIDSASPAIREAALRVALSHWQMEDEIADKCEMIMQADSSEAVRTMAIQILGLSYRDTKDLRIGRLFAEAVKNNEYSSGTRQAAYYSLVLVDGRHNHSVSPFTLSMSDVDWSFVELYLQS